MERISDEELEYLLSQWGNVKKAKKIEISTTASEEFYQALQELKERRETEKIGICDQCGWDKKILIEQEQIKYCPGCGARLEGGE